MGEVGNEPINSHLHFGDDPDLPSGSRTGISETLFFYNVFQIYDFVLIPNAKGVGFHVWYME